MNKKNILIASAVLILGGGGYFFFDQNKKEETGAEQSIDSNNKWNPYEKSSHYQRTLSDFLISANSGNAVVKMSVTLDFTDEESYIKFKGYSSVVESKESSGDDEHGDEEATLTPMELKINDTIGVLMMKVTEEQLKEKELLKGYLLDGINKELGFETPIIKDLYIENFIIQ